MRLPGQSTDLPQPPTPMSFPLSSTLSTLRSVRSLQTEASAGTPGWINISSALGNEFIGLEPIGPALWQVYFGPTTLGWFDEELFVIFDTHGNTGRNPIC